jgi:6-phosphogluconolactonase
MPDLKRFSDSGSAIEFLHEAFFEYGKHAIHARGSFKVAISGGNTPLPFFKSLTSTKSDLIFWQKVSFFWVDERWVPEDHPDNNYGTAMRRGLREIPANFFKINTSVSSPLAAKDDYETTLTKIFEGSPVFDLILLGAGADGHTASVFRRDMPASKRDEKVAVTQHPVTGQVRLTLTLPAIIQSRQVFLLLFGQDKKHILSELLREKEPSSPIEFAILKSASAVIITDIV